MAGLVVEQRVGGPGQDWGLVDVGRWRGHVATWRHVDSQGGQISRSDDAVGVEGRQRRRVTAQQVVERRLAGDGGGDLDHGDAVAHGADELLGEIRGRLPLSPPSADRDAVQGGALHHRSPRDDRYDHDGPPVRPDGNRHPSPYVAADGRDAEPWGHLH